MVITIRVASDSKDGITRFPTVTCGLDGCYDPDSGELDRRRMVETLARLPTNAVQFGAGDRDLVLAMGIDYIGAFNAYARSLVEQSDTGVARVGDMPSGRRLSTAEAKMRRGRVAFVRIYITSRAATQEVVYRVTWGNPKGIVGGAEDDAHEIAVMCCQLAQGIAEECNGYASPSPGRQRLRIVVEDHERSPGLCAEATADTERRRLLVKRGKCEHRRCDLCVAAASGEPPDTACPLFRAGRCVMPGE